MKVNNINGNHFFRFPIKMVFEGTFAQMSHPAKDVFVVLGAHANWKTGECFVSLNTIAERTGYCRRSVIYAVHELENLKAVFVIRRQGYCNHYIIAHYRTDNLNPTDGDDDDGNDGGQAELNLTDETLSGGGASDQQEATEGNVNEPEDQGDGPETEQETEAEADVEPEETIEENTSQQQLDEGSAQPEPPQEEQAVSETDEQDVQQEEHQEQGEEEGRQHPHETPEEKDQEEESKDEASDEEQTKQHETAEEETEALNKDEVQTDAPTSETNCTTQCRQMHPNKKTENQIEYLITRIQRQSQKNGTGNFQTKHKAPCCVVPGE